MIKKTLMCAKQQVFLANHGQTKDIPGRDYLPMEVEMPIEVYWEATDLLKEAEYLMASSQEFLKVAEVHKKLYKLLAPYAMLEKDRVWMYERSV